MMSDDDDERRIRILAFLTNLSESRGDAQSGTRQVNADTRELSTRPAISAFSDNIVFSFPASALTQVGAGQVVFYLGNEIAKICTLAMELGCLIRGGISFGPLHHAGGVLFGKGLVEAYELESKFANYPRIILSGEAERRLGLHPYLYSDNDGFASLNYLHAIYDQIPFRPEHFPCKMQLKRNWISKMRARNNTQIRTLTAQTNLPGLQKWRWFDSKFEQFVAALHPSITGEG